MTDTSIRRATGGDAEAILRLIQDLAEQHNASQMIVWNADDLREKGLEAKYPVFEALVAEAPNGQIVGCAIYFERFSTWKGPNLHIEDLMVLPEYRGQHIGEALMGCRSSRGPAPGDEPGGTGRRGTQRGAMRFSHRKGFDTSWLRPNCIWTENINGLLSPGETQKPHPSGAGFCVSPDGLPAAQSASSVQTCVRPSFGGWVLTVIPRRR